MEQEEVKIIIYTWGWGEQKMGQSVCEDKELNVFNRLSIVC